MVPVETGIWFLSRARADIEVRGVGIGTLLDNPKGRNLGVEAEAFTVGSGIVSPAGAVVEVVDCLRDEYLRL